MTTFLIVFFCIICCAFVFQPLLVTADASEERLAATEREERTSAITSRIEEASQNEALADLELDFALGKLSNEEFNEQRKELFQDHEG